MSNRKPRPGRFAKRLALAVAFVLIAITTYSVEAQTYTLKVLHTFTGSPDRRSPAAGLVLDANGNLYGTTTEGGNANCLGSGDAWLALPPFSWVEGPRVYPARLLSRVIR